MILKQGIKSKEVKSIQQFLNANGFIITKSGPGSPEMKSLKFEYDDSLTDLYEATRNSMSITQVEFQELVGKIEVVGELLIENK